MIDSQTYDHVFSVGNWQVDSHRNALLHKQHGEIVVRPKVMHVLQVLLAKQGGLVTREQLVDEVWDGNQYVGERGVNDAIWQLRKTLDQDELAPYIETIPKKGYRLVSSVLSTSLHQKIVHSTGLKALGATLVIAAIALSYWIIPNKPTEIDSSQATIAPITSLPGNETSPKFSPDGRYLAFTYIPTPGEYQLHLIDLTDNNTPQGSVQLVTDRPSAFGTFSSDSQEIMYATQESARGCDVHILSLVTRQDRKVAECEFSYLSGLDWSPNGRYVIFGGFHQESKSVLTRIHDLENGTTSWLTSPPESGVVSEQNMRFSPDGSYVAVVRMKGVANADIFISDLDGNVKQVTDFGASLAGVDWLDDKSLIVARMEASKSSLLRIAIDTGEFSTLLPSETDAAFPDYSIESNTLAIRKRSMAKGLYTLDLQQNDNVARVRSLFRSPSVNHYPNYSPVNERMAFVSDRSGYDELWLADETGRQLEQITHLKTRVYSPAWSPLGDKIAFTASPAENTFKQIFVFDVSTKTLKQLTDQDTDHAPPTWSDDGSRLFYSIHEKDGFFLWQHPLDGQPSKLFEEHAIYGVEHPSKNAFIYTEMRTGGLWEYDFESKQTRRFIETNSRVDGSNWKATDEGVYFVMRSDANDVVNFYDFATASQETIIMLPRGTISEFDTISLNPEQQQIIFVQNMMQEADIYLVDKLMP